MAKILVADDERDLEVLIKQKFRAKEGQIIIAQSAFEKVKESFNCQPVGEVNLKNKAKPVMLYEVLA